MTLSKNDAIQQRAANLNTIPLLIEMIDEYPITLDILWALSFNNDVQQQLHSNAVFLSALVHLSKESDNEQMRKAVYGILWNLETTHEDRPLKESNDEKSFDIMISYSHKNEVICKKLYEQLVQAGYRVWIDFDQMHGNVMDAMAQAIERSHTVVICMSEQYRRSNYCRAEAHYAFQRQLKIVPILLQEHYQPDGWLLFLIGQLLYVDFTKHEFDRAMELLVKELKAEEIHEANLTPVHSRQGTKTDFVSVTAVLKPSGTLAMPKDIQDWSRSDVRDWLADHHLVQMSQLLDRCDGQGLLYLSDFIRHSDAPQILSLLQEDSLRRTNESLSVVELSCLRALLDQQMRRSTSKSWRRSRKKRSRKDFSLCCSLM